jgi:hypothetical protein
LFFSSSDGTKFVPAASIETFIDATPGTNDMPGRLVFSTTADGASSPTERMRITNKGLVRVGSSEVGVNSTLFTSSVSDSNSNSDTLANQNAGLIGLAINSTNNGGGSCGVLSYTSFGGAVTKCPLFKGYSGSSTTNGTLQFKVDHNGNVTNTNNSYGGISDRELKQSIADSGSQWDDIKNIPIRQYRLNSDVETLGEEHAPLLLGVIAQEVEQVSPGLVDTPIAYDEISEDGRRGAYKSVKHSVLYMKSVKALQEAMERIEQLEAKVASLESQQPQ